MDYFNDFLPGLGVTPETIPAVEAAYEDLLDALDRHFQQHPYVMGGRPCIADFGLMAPMFAHLGRDPVPSQLMKSRAPNVYRWTERMNLASIADGEFRICEGGSTTMPFETLEPVLSSSFVVGSAMAADAGLFNQWIERNPICHQGTSWTEGARKVHPTLGMVWHQRSAAMSRASAPRSGCLRRHSLPGRDHGSVRRFEAWCREPAATPDGDSPGARHEAR
jgi:hypothetical protein